MRWAGIYVGVKMKKEMCGLLADQDDMRWPDRVPTKTGNEKLPVTFPFCALLRIPLQSS